MRLTSLRCCADVHLQVYKADTHAYKHTHTQTNVRAHTRTNTVGAAVVSLSCALLFKCVKMCNRGAGHGPLHNYTRESSCNCCCRLPPAHAHFSTVKASRTTCVFSQHMRRFPFLLSLHLYILSIRSSALLCSCSAPCAKGIYAVTVKADTYVETQLYGF